MSAQQGGPNDTAILGAVAGLTILTSTLVVEGVLKAEPILAAINGALKALNQRPDMDTRQFRSVLEAMRMAVEVAGKEREGG